MGAMVRKPVWEAVINQACPPGRKVLIISEDGDRFALPVDVVVHACRSAEKFEEFTRQFQELVGHVGRWLCEHAGDVDRAYLALEPGGIMLVVVRKGREFNPAFEDALSDFDFEIAQSEDLSLIKLRAIALPDSSEEALTSFLDLSHALVARV
jgi:hypothetical protein